MYLSLRASNHLIVHNYPECVATAASQGASNWAAGECAKSAVFSLADVDLLFPYSLQNTLYSFFLSRVELLFLDHLSDLSSRDAIFLAKL